MPAGVSEGNDTGRVRVQGCSVDDHPTERVHREQLQEQCADSEG